MKQFKLFDDLQEQHLVSIFNDRQTIALQGMSKKNTKISIQQILFGNFIIQARPRALIFLNFLKMKLLYLNFF
jgi:hypothetical protein